MLMETLLAFYTHVQFVGKVFQNLNNLSADSYVPLGE